MKEIPKKKLDTTRPKFMGNSWITISIITVIIVGVIFWMTFFNSEDSNINFNGNPDSNDDSASSSDTSNINSDSSKNQAVSPSVKIESATATLKKEIVYGDGDRDKLCTVTLSGNVTGSEGSFFLIKDGQLPDGSPGGLLEGDYKCPDWDYIWTSGVCTRYVDNSKATTQWSIIVDEVYFAGYSSEEYMYPDYPAFTERFTAILRIPIEESEKEIIDSIYLTC